MPCHDPSLEAPCTSPSNPVEQRPPSQLLAACIGQGDDRDWEEFSARYAPRIRFRLYCAGRRAGMHLGREETLELCQDLFLRFLSCEHPFRGRTDFEFWAYINKSVRHLVLDLARRKRANKRRGCQGSLAVSSSSTFRSQYRVGVLGARECDPEHALLRKEHHKELADRCLSLCRPASPLQTRAIQLTLFEGCTSIEASHRLDRALSPKQVDNVVARLRKALQREGLSLERRASGRPSHPLHHLLPPVTTLHLSRGEK